MARRAGKVDYFTNLERDTRLSCDVGLRSTHLFSPVSNISRNLYDIGVTNFIKRAKNAKYDRDPIGG